MDIPSSLLLNWPYQEKSVDDEVEQTRLKAQQELRRRDEHISQLKEMLINAFKERDEAHHNCQKLIIDKLLLQQKLQHKITAGISSSFIGEDGTVKESSLSDSDDQSSIASSLKGTNKERDLSVIKLTKPLPENGKFLETVVRAGPLLQTLLLSGPMPRWTHPPPPIDHREIPPPPPPVTIPASMGMVSVGKKRGFLSEQGCAADYSCPELKYQRVVLQ